MRPGLNKDDIYIMVEDEFHAVAQQFTKHLHHAEYVRLRNAAKNRNASTINTISRPTDSVTAMREETKKKKQAEAQEFKTKAGVEGVIAPKVVRGVGSDSESDFENEERADDPWQGTQLQRFMEKIPRKSLAGLTGLQGVVSNTRAAAGLNRPEKPISQQPTRLFASTSTKPAPVKDKAPQAASGPSSESDDDDLDAPVRATSRAPSRQPAPISRLPARKEAASPPPRTTKARPPLPIRKPPRRSLLDMSPLPKAALTPLPKPADPSALRRPKPPFKPEPVEVPRSAILDPDAIRRRKARREREERERKKGAGGIGVDEIPVFLV